MAHFGHVMRVALTGGIATGKSTCLRLFAECGVPTIDADRLAREVVEPGTPGFDRVIARFGRAVLAGDGTLDRAALARIVFSDRQARQDLEAIVHPLVYERITHWFAELEGRLPMPRFAVADIPLLYESGRAADFEHVIVAFCSPENQLARVMSRDGLTEVDARQRLAAQWPIERKRGLADFVIDTSGPVSDTARQVRELVDEMRSV